MTLQRVAFQERILWLAFAVALPALAAVSVHLWLGNAGAMSWAITMVLLAIATWLLARYLRKQVVFPLSTVTNLLEALREGDYTLRAKGARHGDAIGELFWEINELTASLHKQRVRNEETIALLGKILGSIDMAVFAFDHARNLRMINAAGERLLSANGRELLGKSAEELNLDDCITANVATIRRKFPGGVGSWDVRSAGFREDGIPQTLLVVTDLSRALRDEEQQAWQRLIRVLGHELNNSLAPVKSIAATLVALLEREPLSDDWRDDLQSGLRIIEARAASLNRFVGSYAALARLPAPQIRPIRLAELVSRVALLEQRSKVCVVPGDDVQIRCDGDQIEQALINLVKNACEAAAPSGGVTLRWHVHARRLAIEVEDDGPGLADTDNLFTPFYTTKSGGSGIGLVLARQIVEAHSGTLTLENRLDGTSGCIARIEMPL